MKQIACSRSFACKHIVNLICRVIANLPYTGHVLIALISPVLHEYIVC